MRRMRCSVSAEVAGFWPAHESGSAWRASGGQDLGGVRAVRRGRGRGEGGTDLAGGAWLGTDGGSGSGCRAAWVGRGSG